jgi:23S rRNA (adenine2503-C2)-methyltransferase
VAQARRVVSEQPKVPLIGLDRAGLASFFEGYGLKPFQLEEAYRWLYARRRLDPVRWTNVPKPARTALAGACTPGLPAIVGEQKSADGTRKFLLELQDGERIECVYIPDGTRRTVCVSSQVGCAMACRFCLTGRMGFKRNLTPGEILGQFFILESRTDLRKSPYNVVFMGMGEPMANRKNLEAALAILEDPDGMGISWRRITVSTAGLADALETFAKSPVCPRLSLSLNAPTDVLRSELMPINIPYPLDRLRAVLQSLTRRNRERISLEYVMLRGVNDSPKEAGEVARFAKGLKVKVNLIPFNPAPGLPYSPSDSKTVRAFQSVLLADEIPTSIRKSRGLDILAACGQLARKNWAEATKA